MFFSGLKTYKKILLFGTVLLLPVTGGADERHDQTVKDLPYGLSLFQFFQDKSLSAITEIDVGKARERLTNQADDAELLLGGLYFSYGLPNESEAIFNQLLEDKTEESTQDRIWFNLARVQYEQGNFEQAYDLLSRIEDELPTQREAQKNHLLTNLYIKQKQFDEAAKATKKIPSNNPLRAYSQYNLGVALVSEQQHEQGKNWLRNVTKFESSDKEMLALLDSTNLALGLNALRQGNPEEAIDNFFKIRLSGPLSNKAILGTGWAWSQKSKPDQALSYWLTLKNKAQNDGATHEAILAVPYAVEQKGDKVLATQYYDQAARNFDDLLDNMDIIADSIKSNELIHALHDNHLVRDHSIRSSLDIKPLQTPATPYLHQLFASTEFQLEVRHYQELLDIQSGLQRWQNNLPVLQLMLDERTLSFEQKRPMIEQSSSFDELSAIQEQRDALATRVNQIESSEDIYAVADEDEVDYLDQLQDIQDIISRFEEQQDFSEEKEKYRLLSGLLQWQVSTSFPQRFWRIKRELQLLDRALSEAGKSAQSLAQASQLNELKLQDFAQRIIGQDEQIARQSEKVDHLIARQQQFINQLALDEIDAQKNHLKQLRLSARYSLARLYDEISKQENAQ